MAREYFHAYHSHLEAMKSLNDAERGRLYTAMLEYSMTGEAPDLRGNERFVFDGLRVAIDRDKMSYARKCAVNRENGERGNPNYAPERGANGGGRGPKSQDKEEDKDINTPSISPPRFIPPTVDDVQAYCKERGNRIDAQRFVDFYSSKGWMVGKAKMKDWRASVRTWEKREGQTGRPRKGQAGNHAMREYTDAEINSIGRSLLDE